MRRSRMSCTATTPAKAPMAVRAREPRAPAIGPWPHPTGSRRLTPTAQSVACRTPRWSSSTPPPVGGRARGSMTWLVERATADAELRGHEPARRCREAAAARPRGRARPRRRRRWRRDGQEVVNGLLDGTAPTVARHRARRQRERPRAQPRPADASPASVDGRHRRDTRIPRRRAARATAIGRSAGSRRRAASASTPRSPPRWSVAWAGRPGRQATCSRR